MRVPIKTTVLIGKGFFSLVGRGGEKNLWFFSPKHFFLRKNATRPRAEASTCRPRLVEGFPTRTEKSKDFSAPSDEIRGWREYNIIIITKGS